MRIVKDKHDELYKILVIKTVCKLRLIDTVATNKTKWLSPFVLTVTDTIIDWAKNNAKLTLLAFVHLVCRAAMRESVVTDDNGISLLPFNRESVVVDKLGPELPVFPLDVSVVAIGHLDRAVLRLELTDSRPSVKPREVVSDVGVGDVHVILREVLKG